jgi:HEAT repeat protein
MRLNNFLVTLGILAGGVCSTVTSGFAQGDTPEVVNAKLDVREAGANLAATIKEIAASTENPLWIGYEVAGFTGEHGDCCADYKDGATRGSKGVWHLENEHGHASGSTQPQSELKLEAITGAIANDPDTEVKKKAVFALKQMPKDEGVPKLIEVARNNKNPEVRKRAMFWLGQSEDPRALAFFEKILKN